MALLVPFVGVVLLAVSGYVGYQGVGWLRRYMDVTRGAATAAEEVTAPGAVSLSGTVAAEETFASPFSGEECVLWKWTVRELRHNRSDTVGSGVYAAPFAVEDDTGRVAVDLRERMAGREGEPRGMEFVDGAGDVHPEVVTHLDDVEPVDILDHDDGMPPEVQRLAAVEQFSDQQEAIVETPDPLPQGGERTYSERLVRPGDEVSVLGDARPDADATPPADAADLTVRPPGRERSTLPELPFDLPLGRPGRDTVVVSTTGETAATRFVRDRMLLVPWSVLLGLATLGWLFGYSVLPAAVLTPVLLAVGFLLVATIVYVVSG